MQKYFPFELAFRINCTYFYRNDAKMASLQHIFTSKQFKHYEFAIEKILKSTDSIKWRKTRAYSTAEEYVSCADSGERKNATGDMQK